MKYLKAVKKQDIMPQSKEITKQIRNKVIRTSISLDSVSQSHGRLPVIAGTMNSAVCHRILRENVQPSVCDHKLKRTLVAEKYDDPKYNRKSTSE